jgi:hypothetical protein
MKLIKALYITISASYFYIIIDTKPLRWFEKEIIGLIIIYGVICLLEIGFKNFTVKKRGVR